MMGPSAALHPRPLSPPPRPESPKPEPGEPRAMYAIRVPVYFMTIGELSIDKQLEYRTKKMEMMQITEEPQNTPSVSSIKPSAPSPPSTPPQSARMINLAPLSPISPLAPSSSHHRLRLVTEGYYPSADKVANYIATEDDVVVDHSAPTLGPRIEFVLPLDLLKSKTGSANTRWSATRPLSPPPAKQHNGITAFGKRVGTGAVDKIRTLSNRFTPYSKPNLSIMKAAKIKIQHRVENEFSRVFQKRSGKPLHLELASPTSLDQPTFPTTSTSPPAPAPDVTLPLPLPLPDGAATGNEPRIGSSRIFAPLPRRAGAHRFPLLSIQFPTATSLLANDDGEDGSLGSKRAHRSESAVSTNDLPSAKRRAISLRGAFGEPLPNAVPVRSIESVMADMRKEQHNNTAGRKSSQRGRRPRRRLTVNTNSTHGLHSNSLGLHRPDPNGAHSDVAPNGTLTVNGTAESVTEPANTASHNDDGPSPMLLDVDLPVGYAMPSADELPPHPPASPAPSLPTGDSKDDESETESESEAEVVTPVRGHPSQRRAGAPAALQTKRRTKSSIMGFVRNEFNAVKSKVTATFAYRPKSKSLMAELVKRESHKEAANAARTVAEAEMANRRPDHRHGSEGATATSNSSTQAKDKGRAVPASAPRRTTSILQNPMSPIDVRAVSVDPKLCDEDELDAQTLANTLANRGGGSSAGASAERTSRDGSAFVSLALRIERNERVERSRMDKGRRETPYARPAVKPASRTAKSTIVDLLGLKNLNVDSSRHPVASRIPFLPPPAVGVYADVPMVDPKAPRRRPTLANLLY